jgi:hypothetical protein
VKRNELVFYFESKETHNQGYALDNVLKNYRRPGASYQSQKDASAS